VARLVHAWPKVCLRYRLDNVDQGWSPECRSRPAEEDEVGVLKVGCVNYGRFRPEENKALPPTTQPKLTS
jgi:type I restriction enzyme S subunit